VGGVTVQQYLAEVERTITDPTLTSTYEKFSRRLLNTKQDLLYLIASLEEDVMTAINPPKQNTSGQFEVNLLVLQHLLLPKKIRSKIKVLTQSI
jgi:hypothetical protein